MASTNPSQRRRLQGQDAAGKNEERQRPASFFGQVRRQRQQQRPRGQADHDQETAQIEDLAHTRLDRLL